LQQPRSTLFPYTTLFRSRRTQLRRHRWSIQHQPGRAPRGPADRGRAEAPLRRFELHDHDGWRQLLALDLELDTDGVERQRAGAVDQASALRFDGLAGGERVLDRREPGDVIVPVAFAPIELRPGDDSDDGAVLERHGLRRQVHRLDHALELADPLEVRVLLFELRRAVAQT